MDLTRESEFPADLSPLAWVQEELRRTLESVHKSLRRLLRDADGRGAESGGDVAAGPLLQSAAAQMHQAGGVLSVVGLPAASQLLRAAEQSLLRLAAAPATLNGGEVEAIERAGFAVLSYIAKALAGAAPASLSLFPAYRRVQEINGAERIHPADLWEHRWQWRELPLDGSARALSAEQVRAPFEATLLRQMRTPAPAQARLLSDLCAGLARTQMQHQARTLWQLAAALFEAQALDLLRTDTLVKRLGSRLLAQLRAGADAAVPDRLAKDLLFFCAQAHEPAPAQQAQAPRLMSVRRVYELDAAGGDYEDDSLGRIDPGWVAQARRRVALAKESWGSAAEGETHRLAGMDEQFANVADSLLRLFPSGEVLGESLRRAVVATLRSGRPPAPDLAMEIATSLLYIEAALDDEAFDQPEQAQRVVGLARRIEAVSHGESSAALETWMEELYRRVADRQTLGSVVHELRASLSEIERQVDEYFRQPAEREKLIPVPGQLQAMRGVFTVLGLNQAAQAALRMRDQVDELASTEVDPSLPGPRTQFDRLANNLGALGFLIDMLSVQPQLAKRMFQFDEDSGLLQSLVGRESRRSAPVPDEAAATPGLMAQVQATAQALAQGQAQPEELARDLERLSQQARAADEPALAAAAQQAQRLLGESPQAASGGNLDVAATPAAGSEAGPPSQDMAAVAQPLQDFLQASAPLAPPPVAASAPVPHAPEAVDEEMLGIFLEEAAEVVATARDGLATLNHAPADREALTTVRRAFHTLKGSSRMVGLQDFGEAAWACEQLYNARLAESDAQADAALRRFTAEALDELAAWAEAIAARAPHAHASAPLRQAADALRLGRRDATAAPAAAVAPPAGLDAGAVPEIHAEAEPETAADVDEVPTLTLDLAEPPRAEPPELTAEVPELTAELPELGEVIELGEVGLVSIPGAEPLPSESLPEPAPDFELLLPEPAEPPLAGAEPAQPDAALDGLLPLADTALGPLHASAAPAAVAFELPEIELKLDLGDGDQAQLSRGDGPAVAEDADASLPALQPEALTELIEVAEVTEVAELGDVGELDEPAELPAPMPPAADAQAMPDAQAAEMDEPPAPGAPAPALALVGGTDLEFRAPAEPVFDEEPVAEAGDEGYKHIGPLRVSIALFNIFLNEADELSRRLNVGLAEWVDAPGSEMPLEAESLAHGLAGSAATVGFEDLSHLARALELALGRSLHLAEPDTQLFLQASDDIRRLLHQFAAGFLKPADAALLAQLQAYPPVDAPRRSEPDSMMDAAGALPDEDFAPDQPDDIEPELFPIFDEEARELLRQLHASLREWAGAPEDTAAPGATLRALHTFKGGARLAGAMKLGEQAHRLESAVERLLGDGAESSRIHALQDEADALEQAFEQLRQRWREPSVAPVEAAPAHAPAAVDAMAEPETPPEAPARVAEPAPAQPLAEAAAEPVASVAAADAGQAPQVDWSRFSDQRPPEVPEAAPLALQAQVRVRSSLLERMAALSGEVSVRRSRLESELAQMKGALLDLDDNLDRLRTQLRELELQAEARIAARQEAAQQAGKDFDPLEFDRYTRFQELTRMLAESVNDVATVQRGLQRNLQTGEDELAAQARLNRELQDDLLRTRMVEFDASLGERLHRVVRQAARESGRQVQLEILGGGIELDRSVLERLTGAFEHLLRNSVVHGIEPPEQRAQAGKPAQGRITLSLAQEGNEVLMRFADDGAGLDLARIRARAQAQGLLQPGEAVDEARLMELIFAPGFTTADALTEMAGRGVGMDVVRSEVNTLGGYVLTRSEPGQGASFELRVPLTTALTQVVVLRYGERKVAVPASLMLSVQRVPAERLEQAYADGRLTLGGEALPFYWLGGLMHDSDRGVVQGRTLPVALVHSGQQRLALHVDEVLGNQEVVVKNLGPQLMQVPGLAGISLLASGEVALIYNPVALANRYGATAQQRMQRQALPVVEQAAEVPLAPLVMVVDDSLTVRRVTQRLLEREGYRVLLAKDGLDAMERLAGDELPGVVLSDIEMPRMDGFDLVRNMRADARLAGLPVIMITSRIAQKHREYAAQLGVNDYLGKPYDEDTLLSLIGRYTAQRRLEPATGL